MLALSKEDKTFDMAKKENFISPESIDYLLILFMMILVESLLVGKIQESNC